MDDKSYQIECTTRDLAVFLVKDFSLSMEEALRAVYNSEIFAKMNDEKTGLYFQSPLYIYSYLKAEYLKSKR